MIESNIPLALAGDKLIECMEKTEEGRKPIAEGLLYEHTSLMISSLPGCGKSTLSLQAAVELAAGLPVFGYFHVPRPVRVLYVQCERTVLEPLERLHIINKTIPIPKDNFFLTDEYQKLNFMKDYELLIECIGRDCPAVEVIFFDPIYSTILGGLSEDKTASVFTRIMSIINKTFQCVLWYNHHNTRPLYSRDGAKFEKDDPFYGSQWLNAHTTGRYNMKKTDNGCVLEVKKDNYNILTKSVELEYDTETGLSSLENIDKLSPIDRLRNYLRLKRVDQKQFDFSEIEQHTKLCTRSLRKLFMHTTINNLLEVEKSFKNKHLYRVKDMDF